MDNLFLYLKESENFEFEIINVSRGDLLISPGEIETHIYIILEGAVRVTFFEEGEKEEHTIRLGYKNSILSSIPSFFDGTPSLFSIECIRKTKIKKIHKTVFHEIITMNESFKNQYDDFLKDFFKQQIEREIDLLTSSPTKRLERIMSRSPQVFQEIPLKYIASYLRMQPETLSRILKAK